jgi:hypothetical protein
MACDEVVCCDHGSRTVCPESVMPAVMQQNHIATVDASRDFALNVLR